MGTTKTKPTEIYCFNEFHNTETTIRSKDGKTINARQHNAMWKRLCGRQDCKCETSHLIFDEGEVWLHPIRGMKFYEILR